MGEKNKTNSSSSDFKAPRYSYCRDAMAEVDKVLEPKEYSSIKRTQRQNMLFHGKVFGDGLHGTGSLHASPRQFRMLDNDSATGYLQKVRATTLGNEHIFKDEHTTGLQWLVGTGT